MTVAYITVLDTFTPYDAAYAVIRIVFIGFLMMGLLYMERIRLTEHIAFKKIDTQMVSAADAVYLRFRRVRSGGSEIRPELAGPRAVS